MRCSSILAAAVIAITGVASTGPAQAATRAAPAVLDQTGQNADIIQVHRKRYRGARYYFRDDDDDDEGRRRFVRRHHYQPYAYYPYAYYPYRHFGGPGLSIQFGFGGGDHWGGRHWDD